MIDTRSRSNVQVNMNGNVVRSEILGAVKMKCYLSGMPELRLGLNDKVMFESTGRSESLSRSIFVMSDDSYLERDHSIERESDRNGGRQISSMRAPESIRERSDHLIHTARW